MCSLIRSLICSLALSLSPPLSSHPAPLCLPTSIFLSVHLPLSHTYICFIPIKTEAEVPAYQLSLTYVECNVSKNSNM